MDRTREEENGDEDPMMSRPMDTEGGNAHLMEVLAVNVLKGILAEAKEEIEEEGACFELPVDKRDELLVRCEKVLLNYGEEEATRVMRLELKNYIKARRRQRDRENERKVRERLPEDSRRD